MSLNQLSIINSINSLIGMLNQLQKIGKEKYSKMEVKKLKLNRKNIIPIISRKSNYQKLTDGIGAVGTTLSKGIIDGSKYLASGIIQMGNYIEQKVQSGKPVEISDSTKQTVKILKDSSGQIMQVTGQMAKQIFEMNVKMAEIFANTIISMKNQDTQPEENKKPPDPNIEQLKKVGAKSLQASLEILDSLDQAACQIGRVIIAIKYIKALGQSVTKVIEKKYGKEASELFGEGCEVVENAGKVYKDVKQSEVKQIAKATVKQTAIQVTDKI